MLSSVGEVGNVNHASKMTNFNGRYTKFHDKERVIED